MKVLVTGVKGQLGYDVVAKLERSNIEFLGTDVDTLDITNEEQVRVVILTYKPDVVIHCAAYTAVDKAEDEKDLCYAVNVLGTKYIANACKEIDAKMVYISTDYVFDGEGDQPFDVKDEPNPINYYGKTKHDGEIEVQKLIEKYFIVRISWVFGINGNNFVKTMFKLGQERNEISVVSDQIGSPTYSHDLAVLLLEMILTNNYGVYHVTNEGYCSWFEFACEIFKQAGMNVKVNPIKTEDYPTKAKRPKNSRLNNYETIRTFRIKMQKWEDALTHFLNHDKN